MNPIFEDRVAAGRALGEFLLRTDGIGVPVVLALPRGGVVVGWEVARALHASLDVLMVRKLGLPGQEEFAMGAIAAGGVRVMNPEVAAVGGATARAVREIVQHETAELERRERLYRRDRSALEVRGRTVLLVDDGLATGSTMSAATRALRGLAPTRIVIAVPVAPAETCEALAPEADRVVCLVTPSPFRSIGLWYASFPQVSDAEVCEILEKSLDPASTP